MSPQLVESPTGLGPGEPSSPANAAAGSGLSWPVVSAALALVAFVVFEVNYPVLSPPSEMALFAGLGLFLLFANSPIGAPADAGGRAGSSWRLIRQAVSWTLAVASLAVSGYLISQSESLTRSLWFSGKSLGDRAGAEGTLDFVVGAIGLLLVLEAARRSIGWALPMLASLFLAYGLAGPHLPDALFPHRGYDIERLIAQAYLQSQGVFGIALRVMFSYVFLFVVLGALLELTGTTSYIIAWTRKLLARTPGGPAKVAVLSSGLMGSLSGSAVANTATTGTFTIPLMRSAGFSRSLAAGVEAAASSGGALMPPVMGAAAYMMLEIIEPPVRYVEILRAAILPASLYYIALLAIVHLMAQKTASQASGEAEAIGPIKTEGRAWQGALFVVTLATLMGLLLTGFSIFRAVTSAMAVLAIGSFMSASTRRSVSAWRQAIVRGALAGVPLVAAAACVGIVIGVVTLTGIGTRFPSLLLPLAQESLFSALALIMVATLVLGMGLPSAVVYLLMATLVGPVLSQLGVVPLAAHFFIFYFGMMAMVTPPVALAAYAASSIAQSPILASSWAAFRLALIGFSLPFVFVYRPELLWLDASGAVASFAPVLTTFLAVLAGTWALAVAITGWWGGPVARLGRTVAFAAFALAVFPLSSPFETVLLGWTNLVGFALLILLWWMQRRAQPSDSLR